MIEIENSRRSKKVRQAYFIISFALIAAAVYFIIINQTTGIFIVAGIFAVIFGFFQLVSYQFIHFISDSKRVILRYYNVVSVGKRKYNSIEFPRQLLYDVRIERFFFGLFTDLTLVIKTRRGVAEYPGVNLIGLDKDEVGRIRNELALILKENRSM